MKVTHSVRWEQGQAGTSQHDQGDKTVFVKPNLNFSALAPSVQIDEGEV